MIFGIGTDLVHLHSFRHSLKRNPNLWESFLSEEEREVWELHQTKDRFLARCFSAKEAYLKALGCGIRKLIYLKEVTLKDNERPQLIIRGTLNELVKKNNITRNHLSFSETEECVFSTLILEHKLA